MNSSNERALLWRNVRSHDRSPMLHSCGFSPTFPSEQSLLIADRGFDNGGLLRPSCKKSVGMWFKEYRTEDINLSVWDCPKGLNLVASALL